MSSSTKTRLSLVEESTHGTTPGTPTMLVLEMKSESFVSPATPKSESENIRTDGRIKSMVAMNRSAPGGFSADLVYPTANQGLWACIRAALHSAETAQFSEALSGASNGIVGSANPVIISRTSGDFTTDWKVGDVGKVTNAAATADNRYFVVTAVVALTLTVQLTNSATWATTDTSITITRGARMIDSTATSERAFSVEMAQLDLQKMFVGTGQVITSMRVSFAMGSKATISFGFTGRDVVGSAMSSSTVGITGASYTSPTELPVFSPTQAIYVVVDGVTYPVRSLDLEVTRAAQVGHSTEGGATPDRIVMGALRVKLSWSAYFAVTTAIAQATAGTEVPVWFLMEDGAGKALSASMGTVVLDTASIPTSGMDQTKMVSVSAQAAHNATRDACLTWQRWQ